MYASKIDSLTRLESARPLDPASVCPDCRTTGVRTDHGLVLPHDCAAWPGLDTVGPRIGCDAHEARAAALCGWRLSSGRYTCPRRVAGKHCLRYTRANHWRSRCLCREGGGWRHPLYDHPRLWITSGGGYVFTLDPYTDYPWMPAEGRTIDDFHDAVSELGLYVTVLEESRSIYYPGRTSMIVVRRIADLVAA
jgi:hypothetical protein